jgi:hypothetical protein
MVSNEPHAQLPVRAASQTTSAGAADVNFDIRWASWIARGRAHERQVRRNVVVWAVLAMGAAIVYAFLR